MTNRYSNHIDESGQLRVKNLSAHWIPELKITEKIGATVYTVNGSYGGGELREEAGTYRRKKYSEESEVG